MNLKIGVIQKRTELVVPALSIGHEAEAFAWGMAQRFAAHSLLITRADLAVRVEPAPQSDVVRDVSNINVFPSMFLNRQPVFEPTTRVTAAGPVSEETLAIEDVETLFHRLLSRHSRTPAFTPKQSPEASARKEITAPVPRAFAVSPAPEPAQKPARPVHMEDVTVALERAAKTTIRKELDAGWGTSATPVPETKPFTLPAPEVRRVAAQVMREIEHRASAARERSGRR